MMDLLELLATMLACGAMPFALAGYPCCCTPAACEETCSHCEGNVGPCEFEVVIDGVVDDLCAGCDDMNGTWILSAYVETSSCTWSHPNPETPNIQEYNSGTCRTPSGSFLSLSLVFLDGLYYLVCQFSVAGFFATQNDYYRWRAVVGAANSKPDCMAISGLSLPFHERTSSPPGVGCDNSSATCVVTANP